MERENRKTPLTEVVRDGETVIIEHKIEAGGRVESGRAKSIRMRLLEKGREVIAFDADIAFGDRRDDDPARSEPIVTLTSDCTVKELSELIFNGVFNPDENEWTNDDCWERCDEVARNVLLDSETALHDTLRAAVDHRAESLLPKGRKATIVVIGGESTTVAIGR